MTTTQPMKPQFDLDQVWFYSYFENEYGEEWICAWVRGEPQAILYGSDCDWEPIKLETAQQKLILSTEERFWVGCCVQVAHNIRVRLDTLAQSRKTL